MPVPQITARSSLPGGPVAAEMDPAAAARPYAALGSLGGAIAHGGEVIDAVNDKRQRDEALSWSINASSGLSRSLAEFEASNKDSETLSTDLQKFATDAYRKIASEAPSQQAAQRFEASAVPHIDSRYAVSLHQTEKNKLNGALVSTSESIGLLMQSARMDAVTSPEYAISLFAPQYYDMLDGVDERYSGLAPKAAQSIKENITSQAVTGMAAIDPLYAKQLLDESPHVNENLRYQLENRIEQAQSQNMAMAAWTMNQHLAGLLENADAAKTPVKVPPKSEFDASFGKRGDVAMAEFSAAADGLNQAVGIYSGIKDKNWSYQTEKIAALGERVSAGTASNSDRQAYARLIRWTQETARQQRSDPIAWQRTYQEPVAAAYASADDAQKLATEISKANPESSVAQTARVEASLKEKAAWTTALALQGPPPTGLPPEQAAMYLNRSSSETHVLTSAQASVYAERITSSGPNERVALLNAWKQQYGADMFQHFFHDVITMPPEGRRVPQEMELGLNINNLSTQAAYMQAQKDKNALAALTDEKRKDLEGALDRNPKWMALTTSMLGEYNQRADKFRGYRNGIINFANSLNVDQQATSAQEAIEKSVQSTIGDEIGFTGPINGRIAAIPRQRPGPATGFSGPARPPRTDDEIKYLGQLAEQLLWRVDPRFVKMTDEFKQSFLPNLPAETIPQSNYVRRMIAGGGMFISSKDGESATLYIRNDAGQVQELRDVNNNPWRFYWDHLYALVEQDPVAFNPNIDDFGRTIETRPDYRQAIGIQSNGSTNWPGIAPVFIDQYQPPAPALVPGMPTVPKPLPKQGRK